jgi:hypothetical protein
LPSNAFRGPAPGATVIEGSHLLETILKRHPARSCGLSRWECAWRPSARVLEILRRQGTQYDLLSEAGVVPLTLGGELLVRFINGFQSSVQATDSFTILTSNAAIGGAFTNVVGGRVFTADGAGSFAVTLSGNNVILGAFVVPEPAAALLLASGPLFLRRRRAPAEIRGGTSA